jgi:hypothetical protein
VICYVRHVENQSNSEIKDIQWDVAGYRRDVIPAHTPRPSCVDYAGEMKSTPQQGPLYYGVSPQPYPTSVQPPEAGWVPKKEASTASDNVTPPLRSDFVLDTRAKDGSLQSSHVRIESTASFDGKFGFFSFDITNDGAGSVGVFLNIPSVPAMYGDVPVAEKPYFFEPKQRVIFKTALQERPEFAPATVVFYGADGKPAALETAGFYVPSTGKPIRQDDELWFSARSNSPR